MFIKRLKQHIQSCKTFELKVYNIYCQKYMHGYKICSVEFILHLACPLVLHATESSKDFNSWTSIENICSPTGLLSKEVQEARNKELKCYREHYSHKGSRMKTNEDVIKKLYLILLFQLHVVKSFVCMIKKSLNFMF